MKINKEVRKVLLSLLGLLFVAVSVFAKDQISQSRQASSGFGPVIEKYTFDELKWNSGNQLLGARAEKTFYLAVPQQWRLNQVKLHLIISHSALLQPNSSLTVGINQTPVASLKLTPENSNPTAWDIELPLSALDSEWLAVKFIGFMQLSSGYDSPGNWLYISPSSGITFNYQELPFVPDLTKLPYPFVSVQTLKPKTTLIVLPDGLTANQLIPALQTANLLGFQAILKGINLGTKNINALTQADKVTNNLIFVGKINELSPVMETMNFWPLTLQDNKLMTKKDEQVSVDTGVIMLTASPWNNIHGALAITGANDLAVQKAASAFLQPSTIFDQENYVLVNESANFNQEPLDWDKVTLKTLGYSDQSVLGLGQNTISYSFNLPFNQVPVSLDMDVKLSHSPFAYRDHAILSLVVNGTKQASLILDKTNENEGIWHVHVNEASLLPGKNALDLVYNLRGLQEGSTARAYFPGWGVIFADSSMEVEFSDVLPEALLNQFPAPFDAKTLIVIPNQPTEEETANLLQFFTKLGSMLGQPLQTGQIVSAENLTKNRLKEQTAILIGDIQHNPWIKAMKLPPISQQNQKWGMVKLMDSPWNKKQRVMVITGSDNDAVNWAINLLLDDTLRTKLNGNFAKIDENKAITVVNTYGQKTAAQKIERYVLKHYGFLITLFFVMVTLVCFVISYYLRHKKS